jgi:hypothetical protein
MKKILMITVVLMMISFFSSCMFKNHYKFEIIKTESFSKNTKFFAFNNLLWVIDRDKLVCVDPDNGEMKEYVDLPGYPTDIAVQLVKDTSLSMIFNTKEGFLYKDYVTSNKMPHIKENKTIFINGSNFVKQDDSSFLYSKFFVTDNNLLSLSYYENYQLKDSIKFKSTTLLKASYSNQLVAYDGHKLSFIDVKNGKLFKIYKPDIDGIPNSWEMPADDIKDCFLSTDLDYIQVYNGKSIYKVESFFQTSISKTDFPSRVTSFSQGSMTHILGCEDGLYFMHNLKPEPVKLLDDRIRPIGDAKNLSLFDGSFAIAGEAIGERFKLVGIRENGMFTQEDRNSDKPFPPSIVTFDDLPEGTFAVGLAEIKYDLRVYAFTAHGLFRSEVIYHDSYMENMLKDVSPEKR